MATAVNDITGDSIATKKTTEAYTNNHERVFGERVKEECPVCGLSKVVDKECNHCLRNKRQSGE